MKTTFTIDDAIGQCEAAAAALEKGYHDLDGNWCKCTSIAEENRQMAEWLRELKAYEQAKEKIELKAEKCPQDEIRYGMRSALYVLEKCLKEVNADE